MKDLLAEGVPKHQHYIIIFPEQKKTAKMIGVESTKQMKQISTE
jgi:hypothetical protein